jgi:hypothetical protein
MNSAKSSSMASQTSFSSPFGATQYIKYFPSASNIFKFVSLAIVGESGALWKGKFCGAKHLHFIKVKIRLTLFHVVYSPVLTFSIKI